MIRFAWAPLLVRLIGLFFAVYSLNGVGAIVGIMANWGPAGWWRMSSHAGAPVQLLLGLYLLFFGGAVSRWIIGRADGRCPLCGYAVAGVRENRRPECGFVLYEHPGRGTPAG